MKHSVWDMERFYNECVHYIIKKMLSFDLIPLPIQ